MRVLLLTHRPPFPPDKGERIRAYYWLRSLAGRHEVDLLSLSDEEVSSSCRGALEGLANRVWIVPRKRTALLWHLGRALLKGCSVTEDFFGSARFRAKLAELLPGPYDACLAVCSSTGAYLLDGPRPRRVIVDLVDVDSEKWRLYAERHGGPGRWVYGRESRKVAALERRLAEIASTIVVVSKHERDMLQNVRPGTAATVIPNGVDAEFFKPAAAMGPIEGLVFIGQMDYWPNVDAVVWFARNVWPEVSRRHPTLRWTVVGRNPSAEVRRLARLTNVTVTGGVDDVRPFLSSGVSIAPLRVACGVQNKVLEAMAAGRPVLASPAAVRGIDARAQEELLVADEPKDWVEAIDLLLRDEALAGRLARRARLAAVERFGWSLAAEAMLNCLGAATASALSHIP